MVRHINSANLEKIIWDNGTLRVFFNNGKIAAYKDVPEGIAVGMAQAPSAGSYMAQYIKGHFRYEVEKKCSIEEENKKLLHHKNTTVGLWATDRPDLIPEGIKHVFSQIKYHD